MEVDQRVVITSSAAESENTSLGSTECTRKVTLTPRGTNQVITEYIKTQIYEQQQQGTPMAVNPAARMRITSEEMSAEFAKEDIRAPQVHSNSKLMSSGKKGPRIFI